MAFASFQIVFQQITRYITHNTHTYILLSWQKVVDAVDLWEQTERRECRFSSVPFQSLRRENYQEEKLFWYEWQLIDNVKWKIEFVSIISFIPFINYYLFRNKKILLVSNQTLISFVGVQVWVRVHIIAWQREWKWERERERVCVSLSDGHVCDWLWAKCEE